MTVQGFQGGGRREHARLGRLGRTGAPESDSGGATLALIHTLLNKIFPITIYDYLKVCL